MNILYLLLCISKTPFFIKNANLPSCVNCIHFIEDKTNYPYDQLADNKYGKCKLFGYKDIITGEIENTQAINCRTDKDQCGNSGNYFEAKSIQSNN